MHAYIAVLMWSRLFPLLSMIQEVTGELEKAAVGEI